jgi:hypothetical protein
MSAKGWRIMKNISTPENSTHSKKPPPPWDLNSFINNHFKKEFLKSLKLSPAGKFPTAKTQIRIPTGFHHKSVHDQRTCRCLQKRFPARASSHEILGRAQSLLPELANNRHIRDKIRQQLQPLRVHNLLTHISHGAWTPK